MDNVHEVAELALCLKQTALGRRPSPARSITRRGTLHFETDVFFLLKASDNLN